MKVLTADEIREWDQYTIQHEPIPSISLMERASTACVNWLTVNFPDAPGFEIFCGKGNNGGDGLAIARLLMERHYSVTVHILEFGHLGTADFQSNLARLHKIPGADIHFVQSGDNLHPVAPGRLIIDALFGSGLNRAIEGITAAVVDHMNRSGNDIISIDIPSGLFTDRSSLGAMIVKARHTLSFQCYKPAFLFAENSQFIGDVHILDIGLHPDYYNRLEVTFEMMDEKTALHIFKPRNRFFHKGQYGHALLLAGSYGKIGAAVLAANACLRSGVGLLTCHLPACGYEIMQSVVPEAMVLTDFNTSFLTKTETDLSRYAGIGIGPGLGTAIETKTLLREVLDTYRHPMVLDADALNILSSQKDLLKLVPAGSILTPHPKEMAKLFGESPNDFERIQLALRHAKTMQCIIVLKGHHSFIASPDGKGFFNTTGNAGMATGGSGDVLTGILTGLLAQGYSSIETALLGVYLHGLAGDLAATEISAEALVAGDIPRFLGKAFLHLYPGGPSAHKSGLTP